MKLNHQNNDKSIKNILCLLCICVLTPIQQGCNTNSTKESNYVGNAQTYWVNQYNITDYSKEIKCSIYRNPDGHWYEIDYDGIRYELVHEIPIDVNENGSLILKYRFKDMNHYIEDIP